MNGTKTELGTDAAVMPYFGALVYEYGGPNFAFGLILGLAFLNVALVIALWGRAF